MRHAALLATIITIMAATVAIAGQTPVVFSSGSLALSNKNVNLLLSSSYGGNQLQNVFASSDNNDSAASNNQQQQQHQVVVTSNNNASSVKFSDPINLTNNPNDSVYGQVASVNNRVYVVWQESVQDPAVSSNYEILFKASQDKGETFSNKTLNLSRNAGFSEHPQLAASGSSIYVVWTDNTFGKKEIFFTKSNDAGRTFDEPHVLSSPGNVSSSYNPEMAAFGNNVYLVWQEQAPHGSNAIIFRASSNSGNTFADSVTVARDSSNNGNSRGGGIDPESFPKVAAYGDNVYVAWSAAESANNSNLQRGLYFAKSSDSGNTFSHATKLNSGNEAVGEAQIAAYGDDVHIIWGGLDAISTKNLYYVRSSDRGGTFTNPSSVESLESPSNVELAIMKKQGPEMGDNNNNNVGNGTNKTATYSLDVVAQVPLLSPDNEEIVFVSNLGDNHTSAQQPLNLSDSSGISECPSISISGNDIYVVWEDLTMRNHEIFLAKGKVAS